MSSRHWFSFREICWFRERQILPLMSEVVPQPEAVQIVIPTQTEVPTENVQTVASGFVDAEMPVEEIDPLMMVMPFGQTEMESGDGVMPENPRNSRQTEQILLKLQAKMHRQKSFSR